MPVPSHADPLNNAPGGKTVPNAIELNYAAVVSRCARVPGTTICHSR
jgi:hypothetical protein